MWAQERGGGRRLETTQWEDEHPGAAGFCSEVLWHAAGPRQPLLGHLQPYPRVGTPQQPSEVL